ncbi:MAG: NADH-quinone oxidoreductase subunit M [Alphaproteobacteria bacterium]|nr:NADH-quinone oxidoreductase subunit M [Alphaproteobacteria bacterium]
MSGWPILSTITFLPLLGVAFLLLVRGDAATVARNSRLVALWTSIVTFALALVLIGSFDISNPGYQFVENVPWLPEFGISYHLGVDGISLFFVALTTFLTPICIIASWESIQNRVREYMVAFLVMQVLVVGVFCALDFVMFYIFFEGQLIPMFLIIGVWGGERRVYSAFKFFLYTLVGSVLFLIAILYMYLQVGTTDIPTITAHEFTRETQIWLWLALFASFAVKMPMWPFHTWLPDAHVEAPTAGSVILAGILLKMGGYGFIRFSLPMLPEASDFFTPFMFTLSVVAIIYTSLVALMQEDMKKLIAYSSVAHMGIVTLGIFTFTQQGIEGGIFQMLSHGIISAALFLCVGVVYDRVHTRQIAAYGGLVHRMPIYAVVFLVFTLASVGLPSTSGFVGEFLAMVGAFTANTWVATTAMIGIILGAAYMLWLYRRVIFGELTKENLKSITDLNWREIGVFAPLIALALFLGIYPKPVLDVLHASAAHLMTQTQLARVVSPEALELAGQVPKIAATR